MISCFPMRALLPHRESGLVFHISKGGLRAVRNPPYFPYLVSYDQNESTYNLFNIRDWFDRLQSDEFIFGERGISKRSGNTNSGISLSEYHSHSNCIKRNCHWHTGQFYSWEVTCWISALFWNATATHTRPRPSGYNGPSEFTQDHYTDRWSIYSRKHHPWRIYSNPVDAT